MQIKEAYDDLPVNLLERLGWSTNWVELKDDQKELVDCLVRSLLEQNHDLKMEIEDLEAELNRKY